MATARKKAALPSSNGQWADSLEAWAGRKVHNVVLPSGQKASVQTVDLAVLALANLVPDDLAAIARKEFEHPAGASGDLAETLSKLGDSDEDLEKAKQATAKFAEMMRWLVAEHVLVAPKIEASDLEDER